MRFYKSTTLILLLTIVLAGCSTRRESSVLEATLTQAALEHQVDSYSFAVFHTCYWAARSPHEGDLDYCTEHSLEVNEKRNEEREFLESLGKYKELKRVGAWDSSDFTSYYNCLEGRTDESKRNTCFNEQRDRIFAEIKNGSNKVKSKQKIAPNSKESNKVPKSPKKVDNDFGSAEDYEPIFSGTVIDSNSSETDSITIEAPY